MTDTGHEVEVPFLIVGAGPVGLAAAMLLADQGHRCVIVERRDGPQRHPAAHVINARTLEIFRQAGLDMETIGAVAQDPADAGHVNFVTRLNGQLIGRLPFERQGEECLAHTPTPLRNISQHHLEPILASTVADSATADLRYSVAWESSVQDADGVTSVVQALTTGERTTIRSRYVLAADGAGSRVRKGLGIEMAGPASLQSYVAVHLAADLRAVVADRPGVLHFVMDPAARGTFVSHGLDREWVFMAAFDPEAESVDDYDVARCAAMVRAAIGDPETTIDVLGVGSWHMSAQVAERMQHDRIFLIGDAAHRFPPTGGLGLNTGVADAHNLVWKLSAVEGGWAGSSLLGSYEVERLPVAAVNCEQSTTNAFKMVTLIDALGVTGSSTTDDLLATLADPANRASIDAAVAEQATHFDMLGLQLGYVYTEGALARDDDPPPPVENPSLFDPDAAVGARLPHAWTTDGRSTLDLIGTDGLTLLSFGAHDVWAQALSGIDIPISLVRVDTGSERSSDWATSIADGAAWRARCRIGATGTLLVRPDQHIAWRGRSVDNADHSPDDGLVAAVRRVVEPLGRSASDR
jgi:2,4-dichlorophenol 6-monooxygenase